MDFKSKLLNKFLNSLNENEDSKNGDEMDVRQYFNKVENKDIKKFLMDNKSLFWISGKPTSTSVTLKYDANENENFQKFAEKHNLHFYLEGVYHLKTIIQANPKFKITLVGSRGKGNKNSGGKELADAAELATIAALKLKNDVESPDELGVKYFLKDDDAFVTWKNTFNETRKAVKKIVGSLNSFEIIHKGTDNSPFSKVLSDIVKKCKTLVSSNDAWCPADIFIAKKTSIPKITEVLKQFLKDFEDPNNLLLNTNNYIYKLYNDSVLYPISLKQIRSHYKIDYENIPGKSIPTYQFEIKTFGCDLSPENTKEIGLLVFKNKETGKDVNMQIRGFPHKYSTVQTEITSDGSATGGRLGKVPTNVIDNVMAEYNYERIKSIDYFGKETNGFFSNWDSKKSEEVWKQYDFCVKKSKNTPITKEQFLEYIERAKTEPFIATNMCVKIQGLRILYFFVKNESKISDIITRMVNGAKKINDKSAFFIKIY